MKKVFALMEGEIILAKGEEYRPLAKQRDILQQREIKAYLVIWLGRIKLTGEQTNEE